MDAQAFLRAQEWLTFRISYEWSEKDVLFNGKGSFYFGECRCVFERGDDALELQLRTSGSLLFARFDDCVFQVDHTAIRRCGILKSGPCAFFEFSNVCLRLEQTEASCSTLAATVRDLLGRLSKPVDAANAQQAAGLLPNDSKNCGDYLDRFLSELHAADAAFPALCERGLCAPAYKKSRKRCHAVVSSAFIDTSLRQDRLIWAREQQRRRLSSIRRSSETARTDTAHRLAVWRESQLLLDILAVR